MFEPDRGPALISTDNLPRFLIEKDPVGLLKHVMVFGNYPNSGLLKCLFAKWLLFISCRSITQGRQFLFPTLLRMCTDLLLETYYLIYLRVYMSFFFFYVTF